MATQRANAPKEKAKFILLAILAFLFLIIGFFNIKNRLRAPFLLKKENQAIASEDQTSRELLKTKDTDKDGLSDYDEQFLYNTSAYIEDSDSDGLKDYDEVKNGSDPNCPRGRACREEVNNQATSTVSAEPGFGSINFGQALTGLGENSNVTAMSLRVALKEAGVDEKLLNSFSDEALLLLYRESIAENKP